MAVAYAVVMVSADLWDHSRSQCIELGQEQADARFREMAEESRLTQVTRLGAEPHVMARDEVRNLFPQLSGDLLDHIVGLYYQADIT